MLKREKKRKKKEDIVDSKEKEKVVDSKEKEKVVDSTPHCSRVVPHPSTKRAQTALTSVFG